MPSSYTYIKYPGSWLIFTHFYDDTLNMLKVILKQIIDSISSIKNHRFYIQSVNPERLLDLLYHMLTLRVLYLTKMYDLYKFIKLNTP